MVINNIIAQPKQLLQLSVQNLRPSVATKRYYLQRSTQTSPTTSFSLSPQTHRHSIKPLVNFKSSSSQTTFLDRNIVDNFNLQFFKSPNVSLNLNKESFDEIEESCAGTVTTAAPSSIGGHYDKINLHVKYAHGISLPQNKTVTASWSCSGASACGGSSLVTKRASSISGTLPDGNLFTLYD